MTASGRRSVLAWLGVITGLIVTMVVVGGITRLTGSGLSITEWKPIVGAVPPTDDASWAEAFARYRQIPQFKIMNPSMDVEGFKRIFFWEYLHRLIGRLLGVVAFLPALWLGLRGVLPRWLKVRAAWLVALIGLQGAVGWFMVSSGLSDRTSVSHLRLALHLMLALGLLVYVAWTFFEVAFPRAETPTAARRSDGLLALHLLAASLFVQIVYGAFVAGLKAGYVFPTFPFFNGEYLPTGFFGQPGLLTNLLDDSITVHVIHRVLGVLLVPFTLALAVWAHRAGRELRARIAVALCGLTLAQATVGALTVWLHVPLAVAATHQATACLLVVAMVGLYYERWWATAASPR